MRKKLRLYVLTQKGITIGADTYISPKAYIDINSPKNIRIGKNCNIARNVSILCHSGETKGGPNNLWKKYGGGRKYADVIIGDNVLIGINSVVMPDVTIGNNCIIACNTVVNKSIPAGKVVGGAPAKILMDTKDYLRKKCDKFDELDWIENFENK